MPDPASCLGSDSFGTRTANRKRKIRTDKPEIPTKRNRVSLRTHGSTPVPSELDEIEQRDDIGISAVVDEMLHLSTNSNDCLTASPQESASDMATSGRMGFSRDVSVDRRPSSNTIGVEDNGRKSSRSAKKIKMRKKSPKGRKPRSKGAAETRESMTADAMGPVKLPCFRLDLKVAPPDASAIHYLQHVLTTKKKIVVIAGAGISVSAGIPDFRSENGLFKSLKLKYELKTSGKDLFNAAVYNDDKSTRAFHDMIRGLRCSAAKAKPSPFHMWLSNLVDEGRLLRLYTQNIDGIDTSMPNLQTAVPLPEKGPWPKTVALHGGLDYMVCVQCKLLSPFQPSKFVGPVAPECPNCEQRDAYRQATNKRSHGIGRLRPRICLYEDDNPDAAAIGSCVLSDLRAKPDAVLVCGTTLSVPGTLRIAREMCATATHQKSGAAIWVNSGLAAPTKGFENAWTLMVDGTTDAVAQYVNK